VFSEIEKFSEKFLVTAVYIPIVRLERSRNGRGMKELVTFFEINGPSPHRAVHLKWTSPKGAWRCWFDGFYDATERGQAQRQFKPGLEAYRDGLS